MTRKRILFSAYRFHPSIGGLETSSLLLAKGLAARGHEVTVVTATRGDDQGFPFAVVRRPTWLTLLRLIRNSDVVWQNHISVRTLWPLLFISRPLIFMHHIPFQKTALKYGLRNELKRLICRLGRNVFVSEELKRDARLPGEVIPNSYDETTFRTIPHIERDHDIAFVGRLRRIKGADLLVESIAQLFARGINAKTTIIGLGPEESALKTQAANAGVTHLIDFAGPKRGDDLARLLNRHKIVAIPSRWMEAFGIVALEAFACGCVVVASDAGALPYVVGQAGAIFAKADTNSLTAILEKLLTHPAELDAFRQKIPAQLAKFDSNSMLDACEALIQDATQARVSPPTHEAQS